MNNYTREGFINALRKLKSKEAIPFIKEIDSKGDESLQKSINRALKVLDK